MVSPLGFKLSGSGYGGLEVFLQPSGSVRLGEECFELCGVYCISDRLANKMIWRSHQLETAYDPVVGHYKSWMEWRTINKRNPDYNNMEVTKSVTRLLRRTAERPRPNHASDA